MKRHPKVKYCSCLFTSIALRTVVVVYRYTVKKIFNFVLKKIQIWKIQYKCQQWWFHNPFICTPEIRVRLWKGWILVISNFCLWKSTDVFLGEKHLFKRSRFFLLGRSKPKCEWSWDAGIVWLDGNLIVWSWSSSYRHSVGEGKKKSTWMGHEDSLVFVTLKGALLSGVKKITFLKLIWNTRFFWTVEIWFPNPIFVCRKVWMVFMGKNHLFKRSRLFLLGRSNPSSSGAKWDTRTHLFFVTLKGAFLSRVKKITFWSLFGTLSFFGLL